MSNLNWIGVYVLAGAVAALAALVTFYLIRRCLMARQRKRRAPPHFKSLNTMTCVAFSYNEYVQLEGGHGKWDTIRKKLEHCVQEQMMRHRVYEVENAGCVITGLTDNVGLAVQCCLEVEAAANALVLQTSDEGDGMGSSTPRVRMGLSTGLVSVVRMEGQEDLYRGRCIVEAKRIATNVCAGSTVATISTWYALGCGESHAVHATGCYTCELSDCQTILETTYGTTMAELYVLAHGPGEPRKTGPNVRRAVRLRPVRENQEDSLIDLSGRDPKEMLGTIMRGIPTERRQDVLMSLCKEWDIVVPFRDPYSSREAYNELLLNTLSAALYEEDGEEVDERSAEDEE